MFIFVFGRLANSDIFKKCHKYLTYAPKAEGIAYC